jgi:hypothetical protein
MSSHEHSCCSKTRPNIRADCSHTYFAAVMSFDKSIPASSRAAARSQWLMMAQRTAAWSLTLPAFRIQSMAGFTFCIYAIFLAAELRRSVLLTQRNQSSLATIAVAFIVVVVVVVVASGAVVVVVVIVIVMASGAVVVVVVVVVDMLAAFIFK